MRHVRSTIAVALLGALGLSACGGDQSASNAEPTTATVTVTGETATVTAPAVTVTADAVTVTPEAVTEPGPTVTTTAPAVTVAAGEGDREGTRSSDATGSAADLLAALQVKGRAPKTGYDRDQFGSAWTDDVAVQGGRNGCDTRNDVLRRDLEDLQVQSGTNGCVAQTGSLTDPFTGAVMPFVRGEDSGSQIHIDHIVSLSNAWETGAQQLDAGKRKNLANDPLNLWAVNGTANQQKGDGDAATWLPPNKSVRCELIAHQIAVKAKYELWVTQPEAEAMNRVLSACPGQGVPTDNQVATPATN